MVCSIAYNGEGLAAVLIFCVRSARQLKPIKEPMYKIYSTAHLHSVTPELLLISDLLPMAYSSASITASRLLCAYLICSLVKYV